jgi:hypothetical protein
MIFLQLQLPILKSLLLTLFLWGITFSCFAQAGGDNVPHADTSRALRQLPRTDTTGRAVRAQRPASQVVQQASRSPVMGIRKDSSIAPPAPDVKAMAAARQALANYLGVLHQHPYFNFFGTPRVEIAGTHRDNSKDGLFYLFFGMVLYYALIRLIFGKYLDNLYTVFFRVSLKQKQIREQLMQSPLPSLLLNIFFILSAGIFVTLLFRYYHFLPFINLWYLMLYSTLGIAAVYLVKFMVLKLVGWIFYITEATDTYIFAVFLVNKIIGIFLIPLIILLAFSSPEVTPVLVIISFALVAFLFMYRYIISFSPVVREIKVSQFHFFLYLCGFEIIPLLLIYKVLITYLERST